MSRGTHSVSRRSIVLGIVAVIALLHVFRVGSHLRDPLHDIYYGYFSDVVIPFGVYFLLCLQEHPSIVRAWLVRAAIVFGVASFAESAQGLGIPLLGQTFDPLDYVMFALGVLSAAALDRLILPRLVPAWAPYGAESSDAVR
jgi:hypothetical protein